nr:D261 [uncultured bacterium]
MDYFHCEPRNADLSTSGCAHDWRLAGKAKTDTLQHCIYCPIGARNAGESSRDPAPAPERDSRQKPRLPGNLLSEAPLAAGQVTFVCASLDLVFRYGPFYGDEVRALRNRFATFPRPINGRPALEIQSLSADQDGVWLHSTAPGRSCIIRPRNWDHFAAAINLEGPVFAVGLDALALLTLCESEDTAALESALSGGAVTPHVADRPWLIEYPPVAKALNLERRANRGSPRGRPAKVTSVIERAILLRFLLLKERGLSTAEAFRAVKTAFQPVQWLARTRNPRSFERRMQRLSDKAV